MCTQLSWLDGAEDFKVRLEEQHFTYDLGHFVFHPFYTERFFVNRAIRGAKVSTTGRRRGAEAARRGLYAGAPGVTTPAPGGAAVSEAPGGRFDTPRGNIKGRSEAR